VKVVRELPAWQALGPNGEAVAAHIEQCKTITPEQARQLDAAWFAARDAARNAIAAGFAAWYAASAAWPAARDAARNAIAAQVAAWPAAYAAWDAAFVLVVRDLITPEQFDRLYGPWASVMGPSRTEPENQ
jgi:hypothetical protein